MYLLSAGGIVGGFFLLGLLLPPPIALAAMVFFVILCLIAVVLPLPCPGLRTTPHATWMSVIAASSCVFLVPILSGYVHAEPALKEYPFFKNSSGPNTVSAWFEQQGKIQSSDALTVIKIWRTRPPVDAPVFCMQLRHRNGLGFFLGRTRMLTEGSLASTRIEGRDPGFDLLWERRCEQQAKEIPSWEKESLSRKKGCFRSRGSENFPELSPRCADLNALRALLLDAGRLRQAETADG